MSSRSTRVTSHCFQFRAFEVALDGLLRPSKTSPRRCSLAWGTLGNSGTNLSRSIENCARQPFARRARSVGVGLMLEHRIRALFIVRSRTRSVLVARRTEAEQALSGPAGFE